MKAAVTAGLKCPPLATPMLDDQAKRTRKWVRPTTAKSEPNWAFCADGDVERDDAGDEEDQEQRPDQLCDIRGESSILHLEATSS